MILLRSLIFNLAFYITLTGLVIGGIPCMFMDRFAIFALARLWAKSSIFLLDKICGTKFEFRNLDKVPKGALLVAAKHESIFETFALTLAFDDFTYILKRQLLYIPLFGSYLRTAEQVDIDRKKGSSALRQAAARAREVLANGRQFLIYVEGTRRPAGAPPSYKFGATHIYRETNTPCLPVALNTGLFWPRRSFMRYPGTIVIEFLDIIPPGLDKNEFAQQLESSIETACNRLNAEAVAAHPARAALLAKGAQADMAKPARPKTPA
ncbi:MAG: 1-acyl-sn-glycerol-3-phosphate acyltransferase [Hyphomicrobiales bacterium]|nr:1-acyl-sn-glycerol-3-phosphate acyltransferase [Hyphomicrobiales bacterium]MDE2114198.1 1-acyl-sn-glycerol-3-phosphate acyltransferase [Hyphomicrobiales bacterium]